MSATTAAPALLDTLWRFGAPNGHLDECRSAATRSAADCDWCRWALLAPEVETLVGVLHDARALARSDALTTVPGAVAVQRLSSIVNEVDLDAVLVPSARRVAERVAVEARARVHELRSVVSDASASGGELSERCRRTAGAVAAAALQDPSMAETRHALGDRLARRLDELGAELSSGVQLGVLLPVIEHEHRCEMPRLVTQPEWASCAARADGDEVRRRQLTSSGLAAGSLEAFVVEALVDRVTEQLLQMADEFETGAPPVRLDWPVTRPLHSGPIRRVLWRVLRVDWLRTFVDTGFARCWNARTDGDLHVVDVPWYVDIAIETARRSGYSSAITPD